MYPSIRRFCLSILVLYATVQKSAVNGSFRTEKALHVSSELNETQISRLASLSNMTHMNNVLDNICIVRVVGNPGHKRVKDYLKSSMSNLGWTVETDVFNQRTPNLGTLEFENVIAKLNPTARRYLTMACHYDSMYKLDENFVGAIDSAVPCAQLLNLATVMQQQLNSAKTSNVSLMFIFLDGEEAFESWGREDSIYGARHLATKWNDIKNTYGNETDITDLDKIDMLMLLDLLGAPNPMFYNYMSDTEQWFAKLMQIEESLASLRMFEGYSYKNPKRRYFQQDPVDVYIEDDHIPFWERNVPILHLIPMPFPSVWHTPADNRSVVDMNTTENLNKILRVFVASYLNLDI